MGVFGEVMLPWPFKASECWKIAPNKSIVGTYVTGMPGEYYGFVRRQGRPPQIVKYPNDANANSTTARGINNKGDIVGAYADNTGAFHGFVWYSDADPTPFEVRNPNENLVYAARSNNNAAFGINNEGTIVGVYTDVTGEYGYVSSKGGAIIGTDCEQIQFTKPGFAAKKTRVFGINSGGCIAGRYDDATNYHGFVGLPQPGGKYELLSIEVPGATNTLVSGISDNRDIVGSYVMNNVTNGFIWKIDAAGDTVNAPTLNIGFPGAQNTLITGINNNGSFVGYFTDAAGAKHAFENL